MYKLNKELLKTNTKLYNELEKKVREYYGISGNKKMKDKDTKGKE